MCIPTDKDLAEALKARWPEAWVKQKAPVLPLHVTVKRYIIKALSGRQFKL